MSRNRVSPSGKIVGSTVTVLAVNFASMATMTTAEVTGLTVAGAKVGQYVSWAPKSAALGTGLVPAGGFVTAANTVTLRLANVTAGTIDPASISVSVLVQDS